MHAYYLILLASCSDYSNVKMSPLWTGPFTFHLMEQLLSSKNLMQACVPPPGYKIHPPIGASTQVA